MVMWKESMIVKMYKIIIVEDEIGARNFLSKFIENNIAGFEVAGTFSNGAQALAYLKSNKVDLCLTDIKMPILDGISLVKEIHENYSDTRVVIISGYGEFDYAKKAIEYNVRQYILKPIDFEELAEALMKIRDELNKRVPEPANELMFAEREKFFTDVVMGAMSNKSDIKVRFSKLGFDFDINNAVYAVYRINIDGYYDILDKKWKYGRESFERAILNLLNHDKSKCEIYTVIRNQNRFVVVAVFKDYRNYSMHGIKEIFYECMGLQILIDPLSRPGDIYELTQLSLTEFADDEMKLVTSHLMINDLEGAQNILKSIIKRQRNKENGTVDDIIKECNIESEFSVIAKAKKYIEVNYSKDITREDVANHVFFNPVYFGRYFKSHVGVTINDYLLNIRMNRAIEMLKTNIKISDIGRSVGYQSIRNFQRIFKLYTGYSATEYRHRFLNIEEPDDEE